MKERLFIIFTAVIVGLLITTLGFFLYQTTKSLPANSNQQTSATSPTPKVNQNSINLTVSSPLNRLVTSNRTLTVTGKTDPDNTLIVSTNSEDVVAVPTSQGDFSATITIDAGANQVITRAIAPSGEENVDQRTVTFSTEDF